MAKADVPPPVALNYRAESPSVAVTLENVIVFRGPGSWKREARWDEYVVTITNRGGQILTILSAGLIDPQEACQSPGDEPWRLEKLSRSNWQTYGKAGLTIVEGAGGVVLYGAITYAAGTAEIMGASGAGLVALSFVPVVAVGDLTVVAVINHNNKKKINAEFARRRLVLPRTLAPEESVHGSLFFPMVPSPRRLILKYQTGASTSEMDIELPLLHDLHLKRKS